MLPLVLALLVAAAIIGIGSLLTGRHRYDDEVERFHRARHLTTEWARSGVGRPQLVDDAAEGGLEQVSDPLPRQHAGERETAEIA
jgi:hypothetical protein